MLPIILCGVNLVQPFKVKAERVNILPIAQVAVRTIARLPRRA